MRSRGGSARHRLIQGDAEADSTSSANKPTDLNDAERRRAARNGLRAEYRALYDELIDILFQLDPIGVHVGNAEKFVPEATTIMARLREARLADDVEQIIQQELRRWYGRRRLANQDADRLAAATIAICSAWNRFLEASTS